MQTTQTSEQSYGFRKACEAVAAAVPILDIVGKYTQPRRSGTNSYVARCPLGTHRDRTPSFYFYPETNKYRCYGCQSWGDVVDLEFQCGSHDEKWEAMMDLAIDYGVALPERPDRWHRWQNDKARVRSVVIKVLARKYQRRLVRTFAPLVLAGEESPAEELAALEELSTALWPIAQALARRRVENG